MYMPQEEWDTMSQSLCSIFDIEYQPSISEPIQCDNQGSNYNRKGYKHTEDSKRLMSENSIGQISWNTGKTLPPLSDAHKQALSNALKGKPAWNRGIPNTIEQKKKISESLSLNNPMHKPDNCKKVSDALKGRVFSAEWKENLSIAAKARCERKKMLQANNAKLTGLV
jgi:hypothetical protein